MWGAWAIGMAAEANILQRLQRAGMGAIQPLDGLNALAGIFESSHPMSQVSRECPCIHCYNIHHITDFCLYHAYTLRQ